jgi:hypothetical protein
MKLKSQTWSRIIFKINQLSGLINKNFDPKTLNYKVTHQEVEFFLNKIEYDTDYFQFIRYYTQWKYIILATIIIILLIAIILLSVFQFWKWSLGLISIAILLSLLLTVLSTKVYKFYTSYLLRIVRDNVHLANELCFLNKRLYMFPSRELKFIALYIIPLDTSLSAIIHNVHIDKESKKKFEERASVEELILSRDNYLDRLNLKNFRNNFVRDFNI